MEETNITTEGAGQVEKTYTEKEFQSEVDKRVKQALDTQSKKMKEAERLAAMTSEERHNEEMKQKEEELAKREAKIALLENRQAATMILNESGLSASFVDIVCCDGDNAETIKNKIDILKAEFDKRVQEQVEERLKGKVKLKSAADNQEIKNFKQMTLAEMAQLKSSNPDIYNQIRR